MSKRLNLGCGTDIRPGWVNLDSAALPGVDVVHDLCVLPLPFGADEFDEILCCDVLEHLDYAPLMMELHRILKPGGLLRIHVPHYTSCDSFGDPTHRRVFAFRTFDFFASDTYFGSQRSYYFPRQFSHRARSHIGFQKGILLHNHLVERLVNASDKTRAFYEETGLSGMFPAKGIDIELVK